MRKTILLMVTAIALGTGVSAFAQIAEMTQPVIEIEVATESDAEKEEEPETILTGFVTGEDGVYYYLDGEMLTDQFLKMNDDWYHFEENGTMTTGWFYLEKNGTWFYFDEDGTSKTGWIFSGKDWYYLENHQCVTGWKEIESEGEIYWFFFDGEGKLYTDCETPDGRTVDENGIWWSEASSYEDGFTWNREPGETGTLSGLEIAGHPAEFYMLCIAGETSGMSNGNAIISGDKGRAYGVCQLDYRYDLVDFMNFAYEKHPDLWFGFRDYLSYSPGNPGLRYNSVIGTTFTYAMNENYETAISDQLEFMSREYWSGFVDRMNAAGFRLNERHVAVSAALFSVNVNCGSQSGVFIQNLSPEMSDEEMIRGIYQIRNTILAQQKVGTALKGSSTRYRKSEPQMALDLLYGYVTIDSNVFYGGGVEWHGNPFYGAITTAALQGTVEWDWDIATSSDADEMETSSLASDSDASMEESEESNEKEEMIEETSPVVIAGHKSKKIH